jgi:hypothetical protein
MRMAAIRVYAGRICEALPALVVAVEHRFDRRNTDDIDSSDGLGVSPGSTGRAQRRSMGPEEFGESALRASVVGTEAA